MLSGSFGFDIELEVFGYLPIFPVISHCAIIAFVCQPLLILREIAFVNPQSKSISPFEKPLKWFVKNENKK
jgi:hypothetical protein